VNETESKRQSRNAKHKAVHEVNNWGKRLFWIRTKLKLTIYDVADSIDIPTSTISDWEGGIRPAGCFEMLALLTCYYNRLWCEKFKTSPQMYQKKYTVTEITRDFIEFGCEFSEEFYKEMLAKAEVYRISIIEQIRRERDRDQIDLFDKGVN